MKEDNQNPPQSQDENDDLLSFLKEYEAEKNSSDASKTPEPTLPKNLENIPDADFLHADKIEDIDIELNIEDKSEIIDVDRLFQVLFANAPKNTFISFSKLKSFILHSGNPSVGEILDGSFKPSKYLGKENILFSNNVFPRKEMRRGDEATGIVLLYAEVDFRSPSKPDKNYMTETDFDVMIEKLKNLRIAPTTIINSGNGRHLIWRLERCYEFKDIDDKPAISRAINNHLQIFIKEMMSCDLDYAGSLAQRHRLPGTVNVKKDGARRPVTVIYHTDATVSMDDVMKALGDIPQRFPVTETCDSIEVSEGDIINPFDNPGNLGGFFDKKLLCAAARVANLSDREVWYKVGAAFNHEYGGSEEGLKAFTEISRLQEKFDEKACKTVYNSFKPNKKNPIKGASVLTYAHNDIDSGNINCYPPNDTNAPEIDVAMLMNHFNKDKSKTVVSPSENPLTLDKRHGRFKMEKNYTDKIGKEEFLYPNLVTKNNITTIIAMPSGGKTSFLFRVVAPFMVKEKGQTVYYIDADSPPSEHPKMRDFAEENGFDILNPDSVPGESIESLFVFLKENAENNEDLRDIVYIVDTMKKFVDLMGKKSVRDFFKTMRKLAVLGATVILAGHANKYRDKDGNLVYEGTGDVRSDTDNLIYFESVSVPFDGGINVTTIVDVNRNAKTRGIFKPFSFNISQQREITFFDKPLEVPTQNSKPKKASDDDIRETALQILLGISEPISQTDLILNVANKIKSAINRTRLIIRLYSQEIGNPLSPEAMFKYRLGENNTFYYDPLNKESFIKNL